MIKLNLAKTLPFIVSLVTAISVTAPAMAQMLKGGVNKSGILENEPGTSLKRNEVNNMNGENQTPSADTMPDPPSFALNTIENATLPPPRTPFDLTASDGGNPELQSQNAQPAAQAPLQQQTPAAQQPKPSFNPADPDSSPEMQIAWDAWHKRVANEVWLRFSKLADVAFANSRPMAAVVSYTVTRDGHIWNARLTQANMNPMYNAIVLTAVNSLNGNLQVLQFPDGSRRLRVDKAGTFIENSGSGRQAFITLKGDRETIRPRR